MVVAHATVPSLTLSLAVAKACGRRTAPPANLFDKSLALLHFQRAMNASTRLALPVRCTQGKLAGGGTPRTGPCSPPCSPLPHAQAVPARRREMKALTRQLVALQPHSVTCDGLEQAVDMT